MSVRAGGAGGALLNIRDKVSMRTPIGRLTVRSLATWEMLRINPSYGWRLMKSRQLRTAGVSCAETLIDIDELNEFLAYNFIPCPLTPLNEAREPGGEPSRLHARFVIPRTCYGPGRRNARSGSNTTIHAGSPADRRQHVQLARGAKLTRDVRVRIDCLVGRHRRRILVPGLAIEAADRLTAGKAVSKALDDHASRTRTASLRAA